MNLIELQHALRQLRLGGIATVLETRLHQAQAEAMAPIDLISCLVADELTRRGDRLLERRRKQAAFRDPQKTLDHFDFNFNPEDESQPGLRPGHVRLHRQARRRIVSRAGRHGQESLGAGHRPSGHPAGLSRALSRNPCAARRAGRGRRGRHAQRVHGDADHRASADHRRSSECASCRSPRPRICWRSSCAATSAPARC